ncbi:hypothetical protein IC582_011725 [Cucumis melo]
MLPVLLATMKILTQYLPMLLRIMMRKRMEVLGHLCNLVGKLVECRHRKMLEERFWSLSSLKMVTII